MNVRSERGGQCKPLQHDDSADEGQARVSGGLVVAPHGGENLLGKIDANSPGFWARLTEVVSLDEDVANTFKQEDARNAVRKPDLQLDGSGAQPPNGSDARLGDI